MGGMQDKADKKKLGAEVFENCPGQTRFLICLFARNRNVSDWQQLFADNTRFFRGMAPSNAEIAFSLASEEEFSRQVAAADIIYFSGGDSVPLYSALARAGSDWTKRLGGKTVIGASAGCDMLSAYTYCLQQDALDRGLGLVKVKTIPHYEAGGDHRPGIGWEQALEALKNYGEDLPVYALREGEFVAITEEMD